MIHCKRCGVGIRWENRTCMNAHTGAPHRPGQCSTKPGYVWCPECFAVYPKRTPCIHYRQLHYRPEYSEEFFIRRIRASYMERKSMPSRYSGTLKRSTCGHCGREVNGLDARQQEEHLAECMKQKHLEAFL